jgi:hypothetical protein
MSENPDEWGLSENERTGRIQRNSDRLAYEWRQKRGLDRDYEEAEAGSEVLFTSLGEMIRFRCLLVWAAIFALIYYSGWAANLIGHTPAVANGSFARIVLSLATGICLTSRTARRWMFRKLLFVLLLAAVGFIFIVGYSITHPVPVQVPQAQPQAHHAAHKKSP